MNNQLKVSIGQYSTKGIKQINQDFHDVHIPNEPHLTSKGIAVAIAACCQGSAGGSHSLRQLFVVYFPFDVIVCLS